MKKMCLSAPAVFALVFNCIPVNATEIGQSGPQFSLPYLQQQQQAFSLAQFAGKVIYLDFWASWCAPCRVSFPALDKLYGKLKQQGFEVVAVNLDEKPEKADGFIRELPVSFTVLRDADGALSDKYVVESMPTSFLIDKQGVVQYIHHGFTSNDVVELEKKITQLLIKP